MGEIDITAQVLRLVLATAAGMAIGLEREWREKAAGFRTLALVSLGSAAFMLLGAELAPDGAGRVAAGVITGIGFLGAGAILREHGEVLGLTTAAAVWMAAALGMMAGTGQLLLMLAGLVLALVVLLLSPLVDLTRVQRDSRLYTVTYRSAAWEPDRLAVPLSSAGLAANPVRVALASGQATVVWRVTGTPARHDRAIAQLAEDDGVAAFEVA